MQTDPTYYEILQVREDASPAIIRAAHRELMRSVHPDVNADAPTPAAAVNEARDVLTDPARRRQYDEDLHRERGGQKSQQGGSSSTQSGHTRSEQAHTDHAGGGHADWGQARSAQGDTRHTGPGRSRSHRTQPGADAWGQEVPWTAQEPPPSASQGASSESQGRPSEPDGPRAAPTQHEPRVSWLSQWPIAAWAIVWLGAQAVADALAGRDWTGAQSVALFVLIGWMAARVRSRGGRISTRYALWLSAGVVMIAVVYLSSPATAVLFGVVYLTWILSTEWTHRLALR